MTLPARFSHRLLRASPHSGSPKCLLCKGCDGKHEPYCLGVVEATCLETARRSGARTKTNPNAIARDWILKHPELFSLMDYGRSVTQATTDFLSGASPCKYETSVSGTP